MYMAEAQVYLDRIADAIRNLNAENVNDISVNLPDDKTEQGIYWLCFHNFTNHSRVFKINQFF